MNENLLVVLDQMAIVIELKENGFNQHTTYVSYLEDNQINFQSASFLVVWSKGKIAWNQYQNEKKHNPNNDFQKTIRYGAWLIAFEVFFRN